jgi:hypothetical protein
MGNPVRRAHTRAFAGYAEVGVHLLNELLEPSDDVRVFRRHVIQLSNISVEVIEARPDMPHRLSGAFGQASALWGDG